MVLHNEEGFHDGGVWGPFSFTVQPPVCSVSVRWSRIKSAEARRVLRLQREPGGSARILCRYCNSLFCKVPGFFQGVDRLWLRSVVTNFDPKLFRGTPLRWPHAPSNGWAHQGEDGAECRLTRLLYRFHQAGELFLFVAELSAKAEASSMSSSNLTPVSPSIIKLSPSHREIASANAKRAARSRPVL